MKVNYAVHPDIRQAETLSAEFYQNEEVFAALKEKVFARSWQWIGEERLVSTAGSVHPFYFVDNYISEPMLLSRDKEGNLRCLSNVCTHRANILAHHSANVDQLVCGYHGRRFGLDGAFKRMPEFKEAENFPRPCDHLHQFPLTKWTPFLFTSIEPSFPFQLVTDKMEERIGFLPLEQFRFERASSKEYLVNAHWALYCDNYLEGFHIPFVHQDLNEALDYGSYTTELYTYCNLQIGYASGAEEVFDLPPGHPDEGKKVAAYYYWVYPNLMFNFYPWGLSINVVRPISKDKTKVAFYTYVYDESKRERGAGALLDKVEREDEFVVEGVHRGLQSSIYKTGRFSPSRELGVHHFHRLLAAALE